MMGGLVRRVALIIWAAVIPFLAIGQEVKDAADYGFLPGNSAEDNREALQSILNGGGKVVVNRQGTYDLSGTVFIDSGTHLVFADGVVINKCRDSAGVAPAYVFVNRGAFTRTYDDITIEGLNLRINRIDQGHSGAQPILGLQGSLSFFYVKNLTVRDFTTLDVGYANFALQVCTFENILLEGIHIEGDKDGIHLGRGKGFEGSHFITGLASHFRDLLVSKDPVTLPLLEVGASIRQRYGEQARKCPLPFLYRAMKLCNDCDLNYRASRNKRLLVELTLPKARRCREGLALSQSVNP